MEDHSNAKDTYIAATPTCSHAKDNYINTEAIYIQAMAVYTAAMADFNHAKANYIHAKGICRHAGSISVNKIAISTTFNGYLKV
ncbi:MAG: hypothetical protein ACT4OJ_04860 [Bacteroidota bacterium]